MQKKRILSCALTGAATTRAQCPHLPYTPKELGEEAKRARDAGASIVHIHAREDNGMPSWRTEVFEEITAEVRKHCPNIIINYSTGAIGLSPKKRTAHLPVTKPEMAALNMSKKQFYFDAVFENPFSTIQQIVETMNNADTMPEMEVFDSGHINNAMPLIDMGMLKKKLCFSFVMGVLGGIPATVENLVHQKQSIPTGAHWQVITISRKQWAMSAAAIAMGGSFRVGLEDNFYLPNGEMAKSNGELVETGVNLAHTLGAEIASIEEAREILGLERIS
ncbi:UNVERIFIED_CONTAM: hypothetical protein GTU68_002861 [Idotea baltica]|nr:hypothetical protein [Idotea baltica]